MPEDEDCEACQDGRCQDCAGPPCACFNRVCDAAGAAEADEEWD